VNQIAGAIMATLGLILEISILIAWQGYTL
jgi:hypothetical protein